MELAASEDAKYSWIAAGYLIDTGRVLLVHHNRFNKWVPPGGHIEANETPAEAVAREFAEETGVRVKVLSAAEVIHAADENATPHPVPFYMDVEREGFDRPAVVQFYYVVGDGPQSLTPQESEVFDCRWFGESDLEGLQTFAQVRSLAKYALRNHPATKIIQ